MGLKETCHCGHDKASHYRDAGSRETLSCLCQGCDCRRYINERDPAPRKMHKRPIGHPQTCRCYECKKYLEQFGLAEEGEPEKIPSTPTDPYPRGIPLYPPYLPQP
jgi:hypothetical protein